MALVAAVVALTACGSASAPPRAPVTGTITGRVTVSPTCPVERPGTTCPPRGVSLPVRASRNGTVAASTRSSADGSYRLRVEAGDYSVTASPVGAFPRCAAVTTVVRRGRTSRVDLPCDSGLR